MLPFMQKKQIAGVIMKNRKPDAPEEVPQDEGSPTDALESAAADLISAVESKDIKAAAAALQAAFDICESQPHEEGEHTNEEAAE